MAGTARVLLTLSLLVSGCGSGHSLLAKVHPGSNKTSPALDLAPESSARRLPLAPRLQWMANYGYCGETSLISAGLYYGQYVSQYDARALASPGVAQNKASSQLLLGVNDTAAAKAMRLNATSYRHPSKASSRDYLSWIRRNVAAGNPVVIAVYMNASTFGSEGDSEYDHIVPVTGVLSDARWDDDTYHPDDVLEFSDNGVYTPDGSKPVYGMSVRFDDLHRTRSDADKPSAQPYSVPDGTDDYGLAVTGVADDDHVTLPVHVTTDQNFEPAIAEGSKNRPAARALDLTVTVEGLVPGVAYRLYRYDSFASVPTSRFNASASAAREAVDVRVSGGTTFTKRFRINSSDTAVFRAVPVSAP